MERFEQRRDSTELSDRGAGRDKQEAGTYGMEKLYSYYFFESLMVLLLLLKQQQYFIECFSLGELERLSGRGQSPVCSRRRKEGKL